MKKLTVSRVIRLYNADCQSFRGKSNDVDQRNFDGDTPLHIAVLRSNYEEVLVLLEAGADPNSKGDMGYTPLHYASDPEIFDLLVKYGAKQNIKNEFGKTPEQNKNQSYVDTGKDIK